MRFFRITTLATVLLLLCSCKTTDTSLLLKKENIRIVKIGDEIETPTSTKSRSSEENTLNDFDLNMIEKTLERALEFSPAGQAVKWQSPTSGNSGLITPLKPFRQHGRYCREFKKELSINGKTHIIKGRACRKVEKSGHRRSWEVIN